MARAAMVIVSLLWLSGVNHAARMGAQEAGLEEHDEQQGRLSAAELHRLEDARDAQELRAQSEEGEASGQGGEQAEGEEGDQDSEQAEDEEGEVSNEAVEHAEGGEGDEDSEHAELEEGEAFDQDDEQAEGVSVCTKLRGEDCRRTARCEWKWTSEWTSRKPQWETACKPKLPRNCEYKWGSTTKRWTTSCRCEGLPHQDCDKQSKCEWKWINPSEWTSTRPQFETACKYKPPAGMKWEWDSKAKQWKKVQSNPSPRRVATTTTTTTTITTTTTASKSPCTGQRNDDCPRDKCDWKWPKEWPPTKPTQKAQWEVACKEKPGANCAWTWDTTAKEWKTNCVTTEPAVRPVPAVPSVPSGASGTTSTDVCTGQNNAGCPRDKCEWKWPKEWPPTKPTAKAKWEVACKAKLRDGCTWTWDTSAKEWKDSCA